MRILSCVAVLLAVLAFETAATPFWGAKQSSPVDTPLDALKPGEFIWEGEIEKAGPVVVVVSLTEQMAYVYRNGVRIGVTTVSTGKAGHRSPTGVFTILNKDKNHHSSTYNNAPMPYSERLTWGGVALHAGGLPGYPSSHGCVHLPSVFAKDLFGITHKGTTVVIADEHTAPREVVHPAALAPVDARTGEPEHESDLSFAESWRFEPEKSLQGPVTLVISAADQRAIILRNGVEIGRAKIGIRQSGEPLGTHAYVLAASEHAGHGQWHAVGLPGHMGSSTDAGDDNPLARVKGPRDFHKALADLYEVGMTVLVTDAEVLEHTTGPQLTVLANGADTGPSLN